MSAYARRAGLALGAGGVALALALTGCGSGNGGGSTDGGGSGPVELSVLIDNTEQASTSMNGLVEAFQADNPDVTIEVETRPQGGEGDNLVKTRLSTGEMNELFAYNTGSLLQALNPDQTMANLADEPWVASTTEDFQNVVSTPNGLYGAPLGQAFGGAVLYNKDVYAELGLEVPRTWDEFMANSEAVKAAGEVTPIIQTYGETWTSQLFVLGDFANVLAQDPQWAEKYTANQAKYVDPPAFAGFQHLEQAHQAGLFNEDFSTATYDDGIRMVATGEGAHYPILTFAAEPLINNYPEAKDTVGTFPLPGPSAETNALTVWQPGALYIPQSTEGEELEAAKRFLSFVVSPEGCEVINETTAPQGPFVIEGCELPEDVPALVSDMQPYFDEGRTASALEFLSPIKGPALEQITVAVGSGITSAAEGAAQYDEDVRKQAQQLGLEGW